MEIKITYTNGNNLRLEGTAKDNNERRELIKMFKMTIADLREEDINKSIEKFNEVQQEEIIEYATDGQKKYMDQLGIQYNDETTKTEAIQLINQWKIANGVPITGKKR